MNIIMDEVSCRNIVEDYINYRLGKHGYTWENGTVYNNQTAVYQIVRRLGDEFEDRYTEQFQQMVNQLHITPNTAYSTFQTVVQEMFTDGVNWGRIVALIGFGGALSVQCVVREMPQLVDSIADWVATYMSTNLNQWISSNGGWQGFVEFYSRKDRNAQEDNPWVKYGVLGAVGVVVLGALMTNRT